MDRGATSEARGPNTVIPIVIHCPKNQILSANISWASIYPSQVIEVHFNVKNSYFLIFIKLVHFLTILPYELQENLTFNEQYYLFWPILIKFIVVHIRQTLLKEKNINLCSPIFTHENYDLFLKLFTKQNCQIWYLNLILPMFKAYNLSIIIAKGIKMA